MNPDTVPALPPQEPAVTPPQAPELAPAPAHGPGRLESGVASLTPEACAEQLKQRFPALFGGAPKPLKLHIQADLRERAPGVFSKAVLSAFLRRHTGRTGYLIALTRAKHRFDLDGAPAGEISAEHLQAALDELARRRGVSEAREAELEAQRVNRAELLRAYQGTTLGTANFCALKGVAVDELDAILELARREAEQRLQQLPAERGRGGRGGQTARHERPARPRG
ncbi:MAG: ProQ/FINO family protein [Rubrivivax sp.]